MPDPDVTVPGMADTYFTRLSNSLISAADWAAAQAWLVGYRIGRDGGPRSTARKRECDERLRRWRTRPLGVRVSDPKRKETPMSRTSSPVAQRKEADESSTRKSQSPGRPSPLPNDGVRVTSFCLRCALGWHGDCSGPCICGRCHIRPRSEASPHPTCAACEAGHHCQGSEETCECPCPDPALDAKPSESRSVQGKPPGARLLVSLVLFRSRLHRQPRERVEPKGVQPVLRCGRAMAVAPRLVSGTLRPVRSGCGYRVRVAPLPAERMERLALEQASVLLGRGP